MPLAFSIISVFSIVTPAKIKYIQDKPTTIKFRALDCAKVKKVLGWTPQYTIEEGVRKTTEWWIENKDK